MDFDQEFKAQKFGPWPIAAAEVFAASPLSFAFVNLKPLVPGHVLVAPRRVAPRFTDLSPEEAADMWVLARRVGAALEPHYTASALTFAVQDGAHAGQTVPHVHAHVMPRRPGDFKPLDAVYGALDAAEKETAVAMDADEGRKPRSREEMAAEAAELRRLFE